MNAQINQLVKSLLQKESIEQCSLGELQQFAERHPYFGAAQLLLTKKLQTENTGQYNEQLQKTLLYFHNPLWVEQLLNDTGVGNATIHKPETFSAEAVSPIVTIEVKREPEQVNAEAIKAVETIPKESAIKGPAFKIEPVDASKSELFFEPFHTVDYFASQGIKFKEEEKPKDKFGLQLKSFTEWLRSMKKLPVTEAATTPADIKLEQKVEQLAEISLQERDVVTEAMAEVWEKQGNAEKAVAIYAKLSLLEPSKSTYFAAKIEELKKKI